MIPNDFGLVVRHVANAIALTRSHIPQAIPQSYISSGAVAEGYKHAVIVLALPRAGSNRANFGSGNIITERHILTCAHLVHG